jgi:hypothetical protein
MTAKSVVGKYRMLIFDGAGSHMSDQFTWYCWQHDIIPFRLPAHTTHLLQPLDVGIFQPLKHWHQVPIVDSIQYGDLEYSKTEFLHAYQTIRDRTFKRQTILSAWQKTGLFPYNPSIVLNKMKQFQPVQAIPLETPMTSRSAAKSAIQTYDPYRSPSAPKPFQTTPTTC